MKKYSVNYDLDKPGQNYPDVIGRLEGLNAQHYQKSAWLVNYAGSAEDLYNYLWGAMDRNDKLFVAEVVAANSRTQDPNVSLWLTPRVGLASLFTDQGLLGLLSGTAGKKPNAGANSLLGSFLSQTKDD